MSRPAGRPGAPRCRPARATPRSSWEGLRAEWIASGLDFEYWLGVQNSPLPGQHLRRPRRRPRGSRQEGLPRQVSARLGDGPRIRLPQPARRRCEAVFEQFPTLATNIGPELGTTSILQQIERLPRRHGQARGLGLTTTWQPGRSSSTDLRARPDHEPDQGRGRLHQRLHRAGQRLRPRQGQGATPTAYKLTDAFADDRRRERSRRTCSTRPYRADRRHQGSARAAFGRPRPFEMQMGRAAMADKVKVLVVGLGNMGASHASAYHRNPGFEIVGLMSRSIKSKTIPDELAGLSAVRGLRRGADGDRSPTRSRSTPGRTPMPTTRSRR